MKINHFMHYLKKTACNRNFPDSRSAATLPNIWYGQYDVTISYSRVKNATLMEIPILLLHPKNLSIIFNKKMTPCDRHHRIFQNINIFYNSKSTLNTVGIIFLHIY